MAALDNVSEKSMTDLDRLEQLNRLRESGALTDSEFEEQKQQILRGAADAEDSRNSWLRWLAAGIVLLLAPVGLAIWGGMQNTGQNQPALSDQEIAEITDKGFSPNESKSNLANGNTSAELLSFATSDEIIGLNPTYLEKRLGVPREKSDGNLVFEVGGCTITYWSGASGVTSFHFEVSTSCQPIIRGKQIRPDTSFGQLMRQENWGKYVASCLTSCGNAADPVIDLTYPGSRSNGFVTVSYATDYDQASKALTTWEQALRQKLGLGEFDTPDDLEAFSCVENPPANIHTALSRMKVRTVWVTNDDVSQC